MNRQPTNTSARWPTRPRCRSAVCFFPVSGCILPQADGGGLASLALEKARALWSLTPLLQAGGSDGGTVAPPDFAATPPAETTEPYDSVEGYLAAAADRAAPAIAPESAPFFLTVRSRAPELTVFETPRISLWPVSVFSANRTPFDIAALEAAHRVPLKQGRPATTCNPFRDTTLIPLRLSFSRGILILRGAPERTPLLVSPAGARESIDGQCDRISAFEVWK